MEKKFDIAYVQVSNYKGKTDINISLNPRSTYYSGERVENLEVKSNGECVEISYDRGRFAYNITSDGCWHYGTPHYASSSINPTEVKPEYTETIEILPMKERLFGRNIPAETGIRTKNGYVELKKQKITKVNFSATNYSLTIEE